MAKLWGTIVSESYVQILCSLGPLAYFEGLLSLYGSETDMWGDMCVAIEDLCAINFTIVRSNIQRYAHKLQTINKPKNVTKNNFMISLIEAKLIFRIHV